MCRGNIVRIKILIKCGLEEPWSNHGCSSCHQNSCPSPQAHWQGCSSQPISGEVMGEKIQSSLLTPVAPRMTILGLGYRCSLLATPWGGPRHSTESTRFHNHKANSATKLATKRFIFLIYDPLDRPSLPPPLHWLFVCDERLQCCFFLGTSTPPLMERQSCDNSALFVEFIGRVHVARSGPTSLDQGLDMSYKFYA